MKYLLTEKAAHLESADCIVTFVVNGKKELATTKALDKKAKSAIARIIKTGDLANTNSTYVLHEPVGIKAKRLLLVNIASNTLNESEFHKAIETIYNALSSTSCKSVSIYLDDITVKSALTNTKRDFFWNLKNAVRGFFETSYNFDKTIVGNKENKKDTKLDKISFFCDKKDLKQAKVTLNEAVACETGKVYTKTLADTPPNICTPEYVATEAKKLGKNAKVKTTVLNRKAIQKLGMGAFEAVGLGSPREQYLLALEYNGGKKSDAPYVLVGKGVTFDTGGNSLKPPTSMLGMKYDMCGAATVLGVFKAIVEMKLPINLNAVVVTVENIIGGLSCKPDDVVKTMSGKTVEILNTDAEGRLILCDALTYVEKYKPKAVIDVATLTGACMVALGSQASGMFSNDDNLSKHLEDAADISNDRIWRMPVWEEHFEQLKSKYADFSNVAGRDAGASVAAAFLAQFTKSYPWAHLDVAGTAASMFAGSKRFATGRPVSLLVEYLLQQHKNK